MCNVLDFQGVVYLHKHIIFLIFFSLMDKDFPSSGYCLRMNATIFRITSYKRLETQTSFLHRVGLSTSFSQAGKLKLKFLASVVFVVDSNSLWVPALPS